MQQQQMITMHHDASCNACPGQQVADGSLYPQRDRKIRYGNITYLDELAQQNSNEDFVQASCWSL